MLNFIIVLFVKKELLTKEEGKRLASALFGRPLPSDYEAMESFVERLLVEARLSSEKKYFNPTDYAPKKTVAQKKK